MSNEIAAALIGVGGAVIGAVITYVATMRSVRKGELILMLLTKRERMLGERSVGLYGTSVALVADDCWGAPVERAFVTIAAGARTATRPFISRRRVSTLPPSDATRSSVDSRKAPLFRWPVNVGKSCPRLGSRHLRSGWLKSIIQYAGYRPESSTGSAQSQSVWKSHATMSFPDEMAISIRSDAAASSRQRPWFCKKRTRTRTGR
jgi:hypothetical protein